MTMTKAEKAKAEATAAALATAEQAIADYETQAEEAEGEREEAQLAIAAERKINDGLEEDIAAATTAVDDAEARSLANADLYIGREAQHRDEMAALVAEGEIPIRAHPWAAPAIEELRDLAMAPFSPDQIDKLPRITCSDCKDFKWKACKRHPKVVCGECGQKMSPAHIHLDYVGHAQVTARLLEIDPMWDWEPMTLTADGLPTIIVNGKQASMWVYLTIRGVTRKGIGTCDTWKSEVQKELIGDAIRNAAMRFGIGLDLWSKSDIKVDKLDQGAGDETPERSAEEVDKIVADEARQKEREDRAADVRRKADEDKKATAAAQQPAQQAEAPKNAPEEPTTAPNASQEPETADEADATELRESALKMLAPLRQAHATNAMHTLRDAGLWPLVKVPDDRIQEAVNLLTPIAEQQAAESAPAKAES